MCGITGFISNEYSTQPEAGLNLLQQMLDVQQHRGPDASGKWNKGAVFLGHNRLSIIDLHEHSHQPFHYMDLVISYNGEVYNYREIRKVLEVKGYQFKTHSDTEVIAAAYKCWGQDCVKYFIGMWAFVIWDKGEQMLFGSRDRFGIKPFNYIHNQDNFAFASELRTLKKCRWFDGEINLKQCARGLHMGWAGYKSETYYTCIHQLQAGYNLVYQNGKLKTYAYWDLDKIDVPTDKHRAIEEFKERFYDSIRLHMRADVEVGGCLSGGLDSSAITSVVGKMFPDTEFKTFTIYYTGENTVDERPFAQTLSEQYPNIKSYYKEPSTEEIKSFYEGFKDSVEVPSGGSSFLSQYFVMQMAAEQGIKVLLDGQGSDEYLIGYLHSYYRMLADDLRGLRPDRFTQKLLGYWKNHKPGIGQLAKTKALSFLSTFADEHSLHQRELRSKYTLQKELPYDNLFELENKFKSRTDNFLYHLIRTTTLPNLLHYEDRNSMHFSIESRVPFLDHRLVEYGFSLPINWRVNEGWTKWVLRAALQSDLPQKVTQRKDKKGFVTPGEIKWGYLHNNRNQHHSPLFNWRLNALAEWMENQG